MVVTRDGGSAEHLQDARLEISRYQPGTRWPAAGKITAPDGRGGFYRIDMQPEARFHMCGIGYLNPEWSHGINKGPIAVGYDEIDNGSITDYKAPYFYVEAFMRLEMTTPDGERLLGVGTWETLSMGRYAPLGLTGMLETP
jgi:hypothetical protein